ncbi:MAG: hypothetical protein LKJ25_03195 [Clostridia bacterium]|jgi:DNA-binding Lrp family transcriptional regulator|nr:hypothetical protein [Clostridia bacterium]
MEGWIKLYRCTLENPIVCKDSDYFAVWCFLLLKATHQDQEQLFAGKRVTVKNGQLITGRKVIADQFNISESKVQRILKRFENEHQIEQQTCNKNRIISIVNWNLYQQVDSNPTTSEQQVNTYKNVKNINNISCAENAQKSDFENIEQLEHDFQILYDLYPKKRGRTEAFKRYKKWISKTGRTIAGKHYQLTNRQLYFAIKRYIDEQEEAGKTDLEYWKNFDTLMGAQILDYVREEERFKK